MYLASRSPRPELISPSRERAGGTRPRVPFPVISHLHTRPSRPDPGGNRAESCPHQRERRGRFTNRPDPPPSSSPGTCTCCVDLGRDSTEPEARGLILPTSRPTGRPWTHRRAHLGANSPNGQTWSTTLSTRTREDGCCWPVGAPCSLRLYSTLTTHHSHGHHICISSASAWASGRV